jgi:hypothetical protein
LLVGGLLVGRLLVGGLFVCRLLLCWGFVRGLLVGGRFVRRLWGLGLRGEGLLVGLFVGLLGIGRRCRLRRRPGRRSRFDRRAS